MMIDENGSAALSVLLFSPLFRRLGSALPLARPPWRERCACVAVSQHRWVIAAKQVQRATTPHGSRVSIVSHVPRPVLNISFFMNKCEFSRRKHEKIVHTCMYIHTRIAQAAHEKRFVREQKTRTRTLAARPPAAEPPAARSVQLGHHAVPAAREQREQRARRSAQAQAQPDA